MAAFYGTLVEAENYFSTRLHTTAWDYSSTTDRMKAMYMATRYIDRLNFKGNKTDDSQELDFPRDGDTTVPEDIKVASFEIVLALLDGVDPDAELENLGIVTHSYAGVRTAYNRDQQPIEHLIHGIPSPLAWRFLKPFLRDGREYRLTRVS